MNFRKSSQGGGVISNPKIYVADFCHYKGVLRSWILEKICNMIFRKWGGGEGVKGRLDLFRKFIRFGRDKLPLGPISNCFENVFSFEKRRRRKDFLVVWQRNGWISGRASSQSGFTQIEPGVNLCLIDRLRENDASEFFCLIQRKSTQHLISPWNCKKI